MKPLADLRECEDHTYSLNPDLVSGGRQNATDRLNPMTANLVPING